MEELEFAQKNSKLNALHVFLVSFFMYLIAVLPILIRHDGLFFYYGDYNVQQVPFYILAHRSVREGNFLWNWNLDLGGTTVGDFAFYLMGSPFFWITIPFPEKFVPYMMPVLMALKYGVAAVTSFFYIRRYTKKEQLAMVGGLLYAFCGFNGCNIVFNHFTDAVAFFPLLLLSFDRLMIEVVKTDAQKKVAAEESDERKTTSEKKKLSSWAFFSLTILLLAVINYYFFFGMVLFIFLYWILRYGIHQAPRVSARQLLYGITAGIIGVGCGALYLNMAITGVAGNSRLDNFLEGYDILTYSDSKLYWDIIKSAFMIPDIIGKGTLFYIPAVKNASLAIFLPLFGMAGVIAYLYKNRGGWLRTLFVTCVIIAFVPILNSTFSLFNTQYYARWYFMPILFMCIMTVNMLEEENETPLRVGTICTIGMFLILAIFAALPTKDEDGNAVRIADLDNGEVFWRNVIITAVIYLILLAVVFFIKKENRRVAAWFGVMLAGVLSTMTMLLNGSALISDYGMEEWKMQMLDTRPELPGDDFYRVETDDTSTNYEMVWGYPTIHTFLSTVPGEIFQFYEGACGIYRSVESKTSLDRPGLRALLSTKYYLENRDINTDGEYSQGHGTFGYQVMEEDSLQNGFRIYENLDFIPMGFTFDQFIRESEWNKLDKKAADYDLVRVLILKDEYADTYEGNMREVTHSDLAIARDFKQLDLALDCIDRAETSCTVFEPNGRGFHAVTSELKEGENLVFFSVPNMKGFSARVDGQNTEIITADFGLMAIPVGQGVHEIDVSYLPPYFYLCLGISLFSLCLLLLVNFRMLQNKM